MQLNLVPHPSTLPDKPDFKVWANVDYSAAFGATATVNMWLGIDAPMERFAIPQTDEPTRRDGLWQTTCFEAFLRRPGEESYREWNFAPSGDWAAYDFAGYRDGMTAAAVDQPPYIRIEDNFTWWALGATIAVEADAKWDLGLSTVVEEIDGTKTYWALAHPADKPDFHHPDCFAAKLA